MLNILIPFNRKIHNLKNLRKILSTFNNYTFKKQIIVVEWGDKKSLEDIAIPFKYEFICTTINKKNLAINIGTKLCNPDSALLVMEPNFIFSEKIIDNALKLINNKDIIKIYRKDHMSAILFKNRKILYSIGLYDENFFLLSQEMLEKKIELLNYEELNEISEYLESNWIKNDTLFNKELQFLNQLKSLKKEEFINYINISKPKFGIKNIF